VAPPGTSPRWITVTAMSLILCVFNAVISISGASRLAHCKVHSRSRRTSSRGQATHVIYIC
jgi:hypothetical protein